MQNRGHMKTKKCKVMIGVVFVAILVGVVWYVGWGKNMPARTAANTTVEIKKTAGQEVVIAKITSIKGNEITYAVAEEVIREEAQDSEETKKESTQSQRPQGERPNFEEGERPSFGEGERPSFEGSEIPNFDRGEMPDMSQMPSFDGGSMPDMSQMPSRDGQSRAEMPSRGQQDGGSASRRNETNQFTYDDKTYRIGNESITTYIPVGTDVITKLGTITTFSRLAANDYLALVIEKDGDKEVIAAVYIIG